MKGNIDDGLGGRLDARNTAGKIAGRFRTALPQVLASTANNLILLDLGMTLAFPTIVIPALHHRAVDLSLSDEQASWLGSIPFICQPLGSVLSGLILQPLGRKRSMLLVNAPQLIGWLMLHWANSHAMLFTATVIMGLGVGFMEAPIITYVGEISQPKLRGILTSYSGLFAQMGFALEYLLGTVTPWRTAAAISAAVPIVTAVAITQVPETPMWLLSRGRVLEAQASLQWLRGWVSADAVRDEFLQMQRYQEEARREHERIKAKTSGRRASRSSETFSAEDDAANMSRVLTERHRGSQHWPVPIPVDGDAAKGRRPSQRELDEMLLEEEEACCGRETACSRRMADLYRPQTLRPMVLITALFFFMHAVGLSGIRPFMVEVVTELGISLDAHWTTVLSAVIGIGGNILCMLLVAWCGKRPLTLVSLAGCAVSSLLLGGYIWAGRDIGQWAPLTLFIALSFCHSFGIAPVPWMMISEVFPFRTRGLASGITAAVSYVLGFVAARTFLPLHAALGLHGVLWLYGALTILGLAVLCYAMPETEGRSLEDIERRFGGQRHAPDHRLGAVIADIAALTEAPLKTGGGSLETELGGVKKQAASVETLVTECSSSSAADLTEGKSAAEPTAAEDAVKLNGNSAKNGKGSFRKTKPASPKLDGDARQTLGESLKQVDPYKPVVDTTNMT